MHKRKLIKPDGRTLFLYSRRYISSEIQSVQPAGETVVPNPHLRWHPLRGEWVDYASFRQERTFLPPAEFNPLAPTRTPDFPTELPAGDYDVAVFENRFPSFSLAISETPESITPTEPANGVCEVVVFTQSPTASLGSLSLSHVKLILDVWADRYLEIGARSEIAYVMPFENKGVEVGVTLHHPHGQIYAYPVIPPIPARELELQKEYYDKYKTNLLQDHILKEISDGRRIIILNQFSLSFIPSFARYPYEVWIAPVDPVESINRLTEEQRYDLASTLKTTLQKFDGLWQRPFPYVMVLHQAPTDGREYPESHLHFEIYPPYRTDSKLKYLAGTEIGAGFFANDALPEEKAEELRKVPVPENQE